jgi:hypothetical protein
MSCTIKFYKQLHKIWRETILYEEEQEKEITEQIKNERSSGYSLNEI